MHSARAMKTICVLVVAFAVAQAEYNAGVRDVFDVYKECSQSDGFSPCLKKKAIGYLDRLARMNRFTIDDGVTLTHQPDTTPVVTEEQLDANLPRALDAKDAALTDIALDKVSSILDSSNIQISLSKLVQEDDNVEESKSITNN